jgi:hypothetical protein
MHAGLQRDKPRTWCALAASGVLGACASAAPAEHAELDPGLDPTVLHSRVKLTNEFIDRDFGISKNTTTLNLAYAFGNVARRDWTVQIDLPLVAYRAGDQAGPPDATGIGDVEMRIAHVVDGEGIFRWALGVETQLNTAAQSQLGDGVFRLSPLLAFAVEPCRAFKFQTAAQFDQSLTREAAVREQQDFKVKPALHFNLPDNFYAYVESELKWDLHDDDKFSAKLKFEIGRGFGTRGEWVLSARYEMPLTESHDQHTFVAGCSYVFP